MIIRRRRTAVVSAALCATVVLAGAFVAQAPDAVARGGSRHAVHGSVGVGDPYFPRQGNGGYDVRHYRLSVRYDPRTRHLTGRAIITARANVDLNRLDLDLRRNLRVSTVLVNGRRAGHAQPVSKVQELVVTPRGVLHRGRTFRVVVSYAGRPEPVHDPDGSVDGFVPTRTGAFVASEPQGSPTWFPVNDTPRDKATYQVAMTVPRGRVGISNGHLMYRHTKGRWTTWGWQLKHRVSSYLVTATMGDYRVTRGRTPEGVPYFTAVDPSMVARSRKVLAKLPAIIDYYSSIYGKYPFGDAGAIVVNDPSLGYALEVATRPLFSYTPDEATLAHELAHQWFGDDVTLSRWRDIWLNEGFAEWSSSWLWQSRHGGLSLPAHLAKLLSRPASDRDEWSPPPGDPGSAPNIFSDSVYDRGAGTLEALRERVGNTAFFKVVRGWSAKHRYGIATVPMFIGFAHEVTGRNLKSLFHTWLYRRGKP